MNDDDTAESLTAEQAAELLGVSRRTLYAYVSRGMVVSEGGEGRERRYPRWSLERLKAERTGRRPPAAVAEVLVVESGLTLIDRGRLFYRGQDAIELSRSVSFEEVACLLWTGTTEGARALFRAPRRMAAPASRTPAAERLVACLLQERHRRRLSLAPPTRATFLAAGAIVARMFAACGATGDGGLAQRLARGWRTAAAPELEAALVLCADHELNASAFTARVVASTDAPLASALLAALLALEGRRHGGATRIVTTLLEEVAEIGVGRAVERALDQYGWIPGMSRGEWLYPDADPRAAELLARLELPSGDPAAQAIRYAEELGGTPTIDFALAALGRSRRLPRDAPYVLFALGRSAGWTAHALEAAADRQLIRPRARYTGPAPRHDAG